MKQKHEKLVKASPIALSFFILFSVGFFLLSQPVFAAKDFGHVVSIKDNTNYDRFRLIIAPEYTTLSSDGQSLMGFGTHGAFMVGLGSAWQIGFGLRQSFSGTGLSTLFTEIDLRVVYSLTGSSIRRSRLLLLNGDEIFDSHSFGEGGWKIDLFISQYFFNLQSSVLPLSGFGAGLHYEFPSESAINFVVGTRIDYVSSGILTTYPLQIFAGIAFWL